MTPNLVDAQRLYLHLRDQKDRMEEELRAVKTQLAETEGRLAEMMAANGQTTTTLDGRRLTVRTTPRISRAKGVDAEMLVERLQGTEFEFLVKPSVHAGSLQSTMREVLDDRGALPREVEPLLQTWEQVSVAVGNV